MPEDHASLSPTVALRVTAAERLGCSVTNLDPESGYLYELTRGDRTVVLLGAFSPLNNANAARIATDKFHTNRILEHGGYRVPPTVRCLHPDRYAHEAFPTLTGTRAARQFARKRGFPLIVKPNRGARGRDVVVVPDETSMVAAVEHVWRRDYLAIVQTAIAGIDVRLDFLDGAYLFGYLRQPITVCGDGRSNVARLLAQLDRRFADPDFLAGLPEDPIWRRLAAEHDWSLDTVPGDDESVTFSTPILNLNRLCVAERLLDPPEAWVQHGLAIGQRLGLRHFGIDFKASGIESDPADATVLEVNSSPSLVHMSRMGHYEATVEAEMKIVAAALA